MVTKVDKMVVFVKIFALNVPIYSGFTIPELSKWLDFHYNFIKKHSDAIIGKMKDQSEGKINNEFVGLKSKMYSLKNIDGKESNTKKNLS